MPFGFLSPLLLGAAAFIAVPWILHHIRRPEREPIPFSSLLFIPDVKREVIERRRLQHLLLMLLRMLLFLLIVWALARPYIPQFADATEREGGARHVILLDTSFSVGGIERFEAAQNAARDVIDDIKAEDLISVITFDDVVHPASEFSDKAEARLAVASATPTLAGTDYESALRAAARILTEEGLQLEKGGQTVHLITDFQSTGMPTEHTGWKLPAAIGFEPVDLGEASGAWSVQELNLRDFGKERFELRAKIRNWSGSTEAAQVRLVVNGEEIQQHTVEATPGNATLVRLDFEGDAAPRFEGYVEIISEESHPASRRYFTWNPERKHHIVIPATPNDPRRWPPAVLLAHALPDTDGSDWAVSVEAPFTVESIGSDALVIVAQNESLTPETAIAILTHIEDGGKALIIADANLDEVTRTELFDPLGVKVKAPRFQETAPSEFALWSWVDFSDPVFRPFQGARFNNFSDIRFQNHYILEPSAETRIFARFESEDDMDTEGPPAMLDISYGEGRALVWAFPIDFEWTNFPKTPRFVPILHESLNLLAAGRELNRSWEIGERPVPPVAGWEATFVSPDGDEFSFEDTLVKETGLLRWHEPDSEEALQTEAINVNADEANPARVTPAEFAIRLCSAPILSEDTREAEALTLETENPVDKWEYGRYILAAILAALALETWYAGRLN